MVKVFLHLGWLVAFLVAVSIARPVHPRVASHQYELILPAGGTAAPPADQALADDGAVRSERSTNLSHITGTARKIQMYIKNRYLQILPDGTVNGTSDDGSDYTILQRQSVKTGQLLVQSVATCLFLCMDSCGLLYGARNFTGDCVFNENFVQHRYITYSSSKYSNEKRTLYMALNKRGQPRKVQVQSKAPLGKLSSYAMVLPTPVSDERVKDLAERILRAREYLEKDSKIPSGDLASIVLAQHPLRHHGFHHLCPQVHFSAQLNSEQEGGTDEAGRDKFRCRKRKKRKKKKRKCKEDEQEGELCQNAGVKRKKKCQQGEGEEECQKRLEAAKRRRKSRNGDKKLRDDKNPVVKNNKKQNRNVKNKKKLVSAGVSLENASNRTGIVGDNQRDNLTMTTPGNRVPSPSPSPTTLPLSSTSTISTTTTSTISVTSSSTTVTPKASSTPKTTSSTMVATSLSSTVMTAGTSTTTTASLLASSKIPIMSLSSSMSTRTNTSVRSWTSTRAEDMSRFSSSGASGTAK